MTENPLLDRKFWHHFRRLRSEPIRQKSTLRYKSIACRMCQPDFFCKIYVFLALQRFFVLIPISFLWFSPRVTFFPAVDLNFWWKKWHFFVIFWWFLWFFVIFCDFLTFFDDFLMIFGLFLIFAAFSESGVDFCRLILGDFSWFLVIFGGSRENPCYPREKWKMTKISRGKSTLFVTFFGPPQKVKKCHPPCFWRKKVPLFRPRFSDIGALVGRILPGRPKIDVRWPKIDVPETHSMSIIP